MQRRDLIILKKILSEIDIAFEMLGNADLDSFLVDEKLKRAVGMTVINIGELVKNITEETRLSYNQIPWKAIAGMRDIAAHKYQTLRMEDVYNTVVMDFPDLREKLNSIIDIEEA
ncbi:DUF86 domain-containing protein [Ruminococcus sp. XPD3002]|uniref:HepT-like ribonuclease domain-containing protein n=1 Tax=Ruminococcus sp. XPD3002 TaxID=1452269 RepID=UPI00091EE3B8|nr:Uncharacterized conserved protein, contains HEPN domain [Ruminococcus flavefaciens]